MEINWYLFFIGFVVWVTVGFIAIDNIVGRIICIFFGGISSLIFAAKKK